MKNKLNDWQTVIQVWDVEDEIRYNSYAIKYLAMLCCIVCSKLMQNQLNVQLKVK